MCTKCGAASRTITSLQGPENTDTDELHFLEMLWNRRQDPGDSNGGIEK